MIKERITNILEHFFISEPAVFSVLCTHRLVENARMACPVRCGQRKVEFNPDLVSRMSDACLEEALMAEGIRILLKHPYDRKPDMCSDMAIALGSNLTIGDHYKFNTFDIESPYDFSLESNLPYELYSRKIQELVQSGYGEKSGISQDGGQANMQSCNMQKVLRDCGKYQDLAALWEEDEMTVAMINGIIENTREWGSLRGRFAEEIFASIKAKINWRNVFAGFRASVLSSKRKLTRMRPNRRTGFENMGSTHQFETKLLVAIDVSGSISSESVSYFYGVVNSAFRYGFNSVDVIQFDCGINQVQTLKKCMRKAVAIGRGGTSFKEPILYAHENGYDGLLILTDGFAPEPSIPDGMRCKIMWVCIDSDCYMANHSWMEHSGRVCIMELR